MKSVAFLCLVAAFICVRAFPTAPDPTAVIWLAVLFASLASGFLLLGLQLDTPAKSCEICKHVLPSHRRRFHANDHSGVVVGDGAAVRAAIQGKSPITELFPE